MSAGNDHLLAQLIHPENVLLDFAQEDRPTVIKALVNNLAETTRIAKTQVPAATRLINERESVGTTAIGHGGLAIPHARVAFVEDAVLSFALLKRGEGWNSLDGAPVQFVFLLLTPKDNDERHLEVLKTVMAFAKNPIHLRALAGCRSAQDVVGVFTDYA